MTQETLRRNRIRIVLTLAIAFAFWAPAAFSLDHVSKEVDQILPPSVTWDCLFFTLKGVSEADPVNPGNAWFAIPRTHPGFRELFATLLAAQKSASTVWVRTTGLVPGGGCSFYAGVDFVVSNAN